MIDFIITRCRDKTDIHSTRAMRGANCWTDHQMLSSKVAFRIRQKHNRQGTSKPSKFNTGMGSSAAGRIQHSQDISWQARQKTPGLVRSQRPAATDSYELKRPIPPESVANQEH
ncbi:hypothetical protein NP493_324g03079 [Ridgeia piscesae]|uniref:Uncharacterized protein n=1 Tax=Ridgeia piscesae TaxID=27915 RepID=A0AAD9L4H0_RIDPI|nr:hypothetical protein NP493_324g03079 [Ridgeia piscesae]